MKFEDALSKIQTGDLAFYHGSSVMAKLVQWKTKSHWYHVGIVIEFGGIKWLAESLPFKGPHLVLLSQRIPKIVVHRGVNAITEPALAFAFAQFDKTYSDWDAVRAGFGLRTDQAGFICSEYVGEILQQDGVQGISEWGMTPQAIFMQFSDCNQTVID